MTAVPSLGALASQLPEGADGRSSALLELPDPYDEVQGG